MRMVARKTEMRRRGRTPKVLEQGVSLWISSLSRFTPSARANDEGYVNVDDLSFGPPRPFTQPRTSGAGLGWDVGSSA